MNINFSAVIDFLLHIDQYLLSFVSAYGNWTYLILFLVIFSETGLIIIPFLPGDSLLFAAGSIAAQTNTSLKLGWLWLTLSFAAIFGNKINYLIGRWLGAAIFEQNIRWINQTYFHKTHQFYERHGGKTIILARFLPIIRTFAPFVAGVAKMPLALFSLYNFFSGILWVSSLLLAGFFLGSLFWVQQHFNLIIYAIILLSLCPPVFVFIIHKLKSLTSVKIT